MDLIIGVASLASLLGAAYLLTTRPFVDRPVGFALWRSDPWPQGVQEEDIDHPWGGTATAPEEARSDVTMDEPTIHDLHGTRSGGSDGLSRADLTAVRSRTRFGGGS
jgi:hypothetical protein